MTTERTADAAWVAGDAAYLAECRAARNAAWDASYATWDLGQPDAAKAAWADAAIQQINKAIALEDKKINEAIKREES
jgi:hypothetical protein